MAADPRMKLFRKAALDKISSPERLDEMMEVTAPTGWLAAVALGFVLAGGVVWGIFGSIGIKVEGNGILIRGAAVLDVTSATSGRVIEITVGTGDVVEPGTVVARIAQPDLTLRLQNAEQELQELMVQTEDQAAASGRIIAQLEQQRRELRETAATQREMVDRGLLTRGTLMATQARIGAIDQEIAQQRAVGSARENRLADLRREIERLEAQVADSTEIQSSYLGRVLELMVNPGDLVGPGSRIVSLEDMEEAIDAIVYAPAGEGKRIEPGMTARVSPATVRAEEYGFMLGEVRSVSRYPVTPEGMARVLRNEQLARALSAEGPMLEVVVDLLEDPTTPSGFAWSSSEGPPTPVFTGTICRGEVIVETRRPISYVLPIFKRTLGE
jgi:HlyD family secretion protein